MDGECLNIFKRHVGFWSSFPVPPVHVSNKPFVNKNYKKTNIELWVSLYNSPRNQEMLHALELNIGNPNISKINILMEDTLLKLRPEIAFNPKVSVSFVKKTWRTKYSDLLNLIPTSSDSINIISNSDIVLSYEGLDKLYGINDGELVVLTRHEISDNSSTMEDFLKTKMYCDNCASSDVWAFRGCPSIVGDIYLGIPGCENMLIMEFVNKNYKIFNFGHIIYAYHLHKNKNHSETYPFTYYFSKKFKLTFVKPHEIVESIEESEKSIEENVETKISNLTQVFNKEFKEYTTLIDVYNKSLEIEIKTIEDDFITRAKDNVKKEVDLFYENEIQVRRAELNKKLEQEELDFTTRLKDELEKKFNTMYETEFLLKKKSLDEQIAREENEFRLKFEEMKVKIIEDYKSVKFQEIDHEVSRYDKKLRKDLLDELNLSKNTMMGKILQEVTLHKEKQEIELNLMVEENDKIFTIKKEEAQKRHAMELESQRNEISILNTQLTELKIEEQLLRDRNEQFLLKIDESCEEYRKQKIIQVEASLSEINKKLLREEEFLHTTVLSHNEEIEKSWKLCILENKENIKEINNFFDNKRKELNSSHEKFISELNDKKHNLNKDYNSMVDDVNLEILRIRDAKMSELEKELSIEKERCKLKLRNDLEIQKKNIFEEFKFFNEQSIDKKKAVLLEIEKFRESEYAKVNQTVQEYSIKCRSKTDSQLKQYVLEQETVAENMLQTYENTRKSEINTSLEVQQKIYDNSLADYVRHIDDKMKGEYTRLCVEQEKAIKAWNTEYVTEQQKLNNLRIEKAEALATISKQSDAIIAESTSKISESIKIFNAEQISRMSRMKEKLEEAKSKILTQHDDLRSSEIAKIERIIKEKIFLFEKQQKDRETELLQIYSDKKSKIDDEIETLRAESRLKLISETNHSRDELTAELEDELKTYRESQIEVIRKEIEADVLAKLEKTITQRDSEDIKNREDEHRQFKEYMDTLRETEIGIIQKTKESVIARLDVRITELRKQLFEIENTIRAVKS